MSSSLAKIKYQDGIYQGTFNNDVRDGVGLFIWDSGEFFFGKYF